MTEGALFLRKMINEKDWKKVPVPPGFSDIEGRHIVAENGLGAYVVDGRPQGDAKKATLIYPQWSDGTLHNPMSRRRAEVAAAVTKSLVVYVDNAGVELTRPPMDKNIRKALWKGDFTPGATQQWDAVGEALDQYGLNFDAVSRVVGSSLGAHVAVAAAATAPGEVHLNEIHLLETAGLDKKKSLADFVLNFLMHGGDCSEEFVKTNPEWAKDLREVDGIKPLWKLAWQRPAGLLLYPIAIDRTDIAEMLIRTKDKKGSAIDGDTAIGVLYGTESQVSPREQNEIFARRLAQSGFKNVVIFSAEGGVHASQENMGFWYKALQYMDDWARKSNY